MSTKRKSCYLVLAGLAALVLLAIGTVHIAKGYEYEESVVPSNDKDDPQDIETETYIEDADSGSNAYSDGYALCSAHSYTWATEGDGAYTIVLKDIPTKLGMVCEFYIAHVGETEQSQEENHERDTVRQQPKNR